MDVIVVILIFAIGTYFLTNIISASNSEKTTNRTTNPPNPRTTKSVNNITDTDYQVKDKLLNITVSDYSTYLQVIREYYLNYGEIMFKLNNIFHVIKTYHLDTNFNITTDDVRRDLLNFQKYIRALKEHYIYCLEYEKDMFAKENITYFIQNDYKQCHLENKITTDEVYRDLFVLKNYIEILKKYYLNYGKNLNDDDISCFMQMYGLDNYLSFYDVHRDLMNLEYAIYNTIDTYEEEIPYNTETTYEEHKSYQPSISSSEHLETGNCGNNGSNLPIPYEEQVLNEINRMPKNFEYNSPNRIDAQLVDACIAVVNGVVGKVVNMNTVEQLKITLDRKRQRNQTVSAYNKALENNILFELYKYADIIALFNIMDKHKSKVTEINFEKFWNLLFNDCQNSIENREQLIRSNSAVKNILTSYSQQNTETREYDYIFACLKTSLIIEAMQSILFGTLQNGNDKPFSTYEMFSKFSAVDNKCALNEVIDHAIGLRLNKLY